MRNRSTVSNLALFCIVTAGLLSGRLLPADDGPEVPRIDSVVMSVPLPQASDDAVIWYDEFDGPEKEQAWDQCRVPGDVLERRLAGHTIPLDRQFHYFDPAYRTTVYAHFHTRMRELDEAT